MEQDKGASEARTEVSMEWFNWVLDCALSEAVQVHGIEARGVAWTVLREFKNRLPSGYAIIVSPDAITLAPNPHRNTQGAK